jgi:hypothetical protein
MNCPYEMLQNNKKTIKNPMCFTKSLYYFTTGPGVTRFLFLKLPWLKVHR